MLAICVLGLVGCQPLAISMLGAGAGAALRYGIGELIYAHSGKRSIEIELEPISPKATRIRIAAKNGGLFYDNATASEIVAQTERLLDPAATAASRF